MNEGLRIERGLDLEFYDLFCIFLLTNVKNKAIFFLILKMV